MRRHQEKEKEGSARFYHVKTSVWKRGIENKHQAQNIKNQSESHYSKMDLKTVEKHQHP